MAAVPDALTLWLCEALAPLGPVVPGRLFGGWALRCDGVLFAVVLGGRFYLRCDPALRRALEAEGGETFSYLRAGRMVEVGRFVTAPEACLDDPALLRDWALRALAANGGAARPGAGPFDPGPES